MKRIQSNVIGIDQGDTVLFSDYEDGGEMWTGHGSRERRKQVTFSEPFTYPPSVHCTLSLWDVDSEGNMRADVGAKDITETGFTIVFKTWGDTRIARMRVGWIAIGPVRNDDDWELY